MTSRNDALESHLERVRIVNPAFEIPMIDPWSPGTIDALTDLTEKNGRLSGLSGEYRLQYFAGRDLPVELNILEAETGRRIAQDGSEDLEILERLRRRFG
jgi:hypothetical protein